MEALEMKFYSNRSPKKGCSWETPPTPVPDSEIKETVEAEVLVIGGGISGLAASARCAWKGLDVVVIDKSPKMFALAGQIAAVNSRVMAKKGIVIDKKKLAADWMKVSGSRVQEELLWIFINRSAEGFHFLLDLADEENLDVSVYVPYKGPVFEEYPGTHHVFKKKECTKYKNFGGGMLVCEIFENALLEKGGRLFRGVAAEQLLKDETGRVIGCVAKDSEGIYRKYIGKKGVVLATGDCTDNEEMLNAFCPTGARVGRHFPRGGNNTGDGQRMAYWAGAAMDNFEWAPILHDHAYCRFQGFYLHVNTLGKRFMNEDTWMQAKQVRCLMQPGGDHCYTVMDSKYLDEMGERWNEVGGQGMAPLSVEGEGYNRGMFESKINKAVEDGTAWTADTIEELAEKMDVPADTLKKTVERYNEIVASGDDVDFGKRKSLLTSVTKPPFYALKWGPMLLDVFGGAQTNSELNVIDADGAPIPGFYAVGNCAGGMYSVDYPLLLNGNSYGRSLAYAMQIGDVLSAK